jgi:hypothetical protein
LVEQLRQYLGSVVQQAIKSGSAQFEHNHPIRPPDFAAYIPRIATVTTENSKAG